MTLSELLKNTNLRNFITTRISFAMCFNMLNTVISWQVFELTGSYWALGFVGLVVIIPYVITSLFSGYIADTRDRKTIIILCLFFYAICNFVLFVMNAYYKDVLLDLGIRVIYFILFITGIIRGFQGPSQSAYVAQLTGSEKYAEVATWLTLTWHIASVGGPAIAGLIYSKYGVSAVYSVIFILSVTALIFAILLPKTPIPIQNKQESIFESLSKGFGFVLKNQIILGAISLDMFAVLFGGAVALIPAFTKEILLSGPEMLGFLRAAPAVGGILVGSYLTQHPPTHNAGRKLLWCVAGFGVCTIIFALSNNYYLSLLALAGTGGFDNVSMVIRGTISQLYTPDDMRGRVSAVNGIFIGTSNELGEFESGSAAALLGLVPSVVFGGIMTLVTVGITAKYAPKLRDLSL